MSNDPDCDHPDFTVADIAAAMKVYEESLEHGFHPSQVSSLESSPYPELLNLTWMDLVNADPHEVRARELEALSDYKRAKRVRTCGTSVGAPWGAIRCRQRECPGCSEETAHANHRKVLQRVLKMKNPRYVLVCVRSAGLGAENIREAVTYLRNSVQGLRKKCFGTSVPAGVGAIEPRLMNDKTCFSVHSHMALDISGPLDEGAATAELEGADDLQGLVPRGDPVARPGRARESIRCVCEQGPRLVSPSRCSTRPAARDGVESDARPPPADRVAQVDPAGSVVLRPNAFWRPLITAPVSSFLAASTSTRTETISICCASRSRTCVRTVEDVGPDRSLTIA